MITYSMNSTDAFIFLNNRVQKYGSTAKRNPFSFSAKMVMNAKKLIKEIRASNVDKVWDICPFDCALINVRQ